MKQLITSVLNFFYPLVRKFMPEQTYRYAACGAITTVLGLSAYYIGYEFLFARRNFDFGFFVFKPHMAALFLSFLVSLSVGFCFSKFIVFPGSDIKGRIQLFRYFITAVFNLLLNYVLLKLFVEIFFWNVMVSQVLTTCVIIVVSFLSQKYFSFKVSASDPTEK